MDIKRQFGWPSRWPTSKKSGTGSNNIFRNILKNYDIGDGWVDPMCGRDDRCEFRNDINPKNKVAITHGDALTYLKSLPRGLFRGVIYDPPYNDLQSLKYCKNFISKSNLRYWYNIRKQISRIVESGGTIIMFNWNSNSFPNCDVKKVWLIAHGSERHDTIVSEHRKRNMLF